MLEVELLGFAPDLDPALSGVIIDGTRFIPSQYGFKPMREPTDVGLNALPSDCRGAVVISKLDDSKRIFAGTETAIYEYAGSTSWNNVSGETYASGSEARWRFAQFGDYTYAVNRGNNMQYTTGANFSSVAGAPKASIIEQAWPGFLMAFDYNDGTNDYKDGWYCSALQNPNDWTPSIATQSANGRLTDTAGSIRAARRLGQDIVVYKEQSMYLGRYQGAPFVWEWQLLSDKIGTPSQESVVNIDTAHIFAGYDNFYYFDGSRPVSIGNPLKEWYNANINQQYRHRMLSMVDKDNSCVYFFYADVDGKIRAGLVYHYKADKWGKASVYSGNTIEACLEMISGDTNRYTYDSIGSFFNTYDDLPVIPYDSSFWTASTFKPAIFQNDHKLYSLTGIPSNNSIAESTIECNYNGIESVYSGVNRVRLKYKLDNTNTANVILRGKKYMGGAVITSSARTFNGSKADIIFVSKFVSPKFTFRGDYEISGYSLNIIDEGSDE